MLISDNTQVRKKYFLKNVTELIRYSTTRNYEGYPISTANSTGSDNMMINSETKDPYVSNASSVFSQLFFGSS